MSLDEESQASHRTVSFYYRSPHLCCSWLQFLFVFYFFARQPSFTLLILNASKLFDFMVEG